MFAVCDAVRGVQSVLRHDGYGIAGELVIGSTRRDLMPVVHPGFERQTTNVEWKTALTEWKATNVSK